MPTRLSLSLVIFLPTIEDDEVKSQKNDQHCCLKYVVRAVEGLSGDWQHVGLNFFDSAMFRTNQCVCLSFDY